MERSPPGSSHGVPTQQHPQYYYQQQHDLHYQQSRYESENPAAATCAKSEPPPASYPAFHVAAGTSPNVMMSAAPEAHAPAAPHPPPLDDEMNHWLVDICAQLGTAEDDHQQQGDSSGTTRFGSAVAAITAALPPQPTLLAVPPLSMQHVVQFAPEYDASPSYAVMSSSSSPGSSSVDSGGEASQPRVAPAAASAFATSNNASGTRRGRAKKLGAKVPARGSDGDDGNDEELGGDGSETQGMTTAEARREKNRLRVRRHYYRKLSQMNDLRAQVSELEDKIQEMRLQNGASGNGRRLLTGDPSSPNTALTMDGPVVLSPQQHKMELFLRQLDDAKRVLETENQQAREVLYQQTRQFMLTRQHLVDESKYLATSFPVPFIVKKRLAPDECDRIWQNAKHELSALVGHRTPRGPFSDGGEGIGGWKTTRAIEDGAFKFVFQKMLLNRTAEQTLDASWAIFKDPKGFTKLYSPAVKMWCSVVQVVDDDNVVLFQEHQSMDKSEVHMVMKTILLVSRVKQRHNNVNGATAEEYSITLRGLEHEQLMLEDLSVSVRDGYEVWNDVNCWYVPRAWCPDLSVLMYA